jgi:hypothetical protein
MAGSELVRSLITFEPSRNVSAFNALPANGDLGKGLLSSPKRHAGPAKSFRLQITCNFGVEKKDPSNGRIRHSLRELKMESGEICRLPASGHCL